MSDSTKIKDAAAYVLEQHAPTLQRLADYDKGLKFDGSKPDLSLLPPEFLEQTALAFMYGEKKYGRYNFTGGMAWHRIGAACLRHMSSWLWGEDCDQESGLSHLAHAAACIAMLCVFVKRNLGTDTRYKGPQ